MSGIREKFNPAVNVQIMADAAREGNLGMAQDLLRAHVRLVGNVDLAVLNIGNTLFDRVLGSESVISSDEAKQYPNVKEVISEVRAEMGDKALRVPVLA